MRVAVLFAAFGCFRVCVTMAAQLARVDDLSIFVKGLVYQPTRRPLHGENLVKYLTIK